MKLEVIYIKDKNKWDKVVKSFLNYDVYYLSGYVKAFELNGDGLPILFYIYNESTRAINVTMLRDISDYDEFNNIIKKRQYFDMITPYGYGGFLIEGTEIDLIKHAYEKYCVENNIVSEFVRFSPVIKNYEGLDNMYDIIQLGNTVYISTINQDSVWSSFDGKNRNVIRKAKNNNVAIYFSTNDDLINDFIKIYNETMKRDNAREYYFFKKDFYNSIINDLKGNYMFIYAVYNEKIISIAIFLLANKKMHYHLSASIKEYQILAPTNLLLYEAACYGIKNGYDLLHLGGGLGAKKDNLYKFKKAFNKYEDMKFCVGRKIFNQNVYNYLVKLRKLEINNDENYFPLYRV